MGEGGCSKLQVQLVPCWALNRHRHPCPCRPAIHGALQGCLALLSRPHSSSSSSSGGSSPAPSSPLPPLASADATAMLHACTGHVFVRSLAQPERSLALQLLEQSVRQHGQALLDDNVDLLEWAIASVDGEKDPRCLVAAFRALRELLRLYHQQPETSLHLERLEVGAECEGSCELCPWGALEGCSGATILAVAAAGPASTQSRPHVAGHPARPAASWLQLALQRQGRAAMSCFEPAAELTWHVAAC